MNLNIVSKKIADGSSYAAIAQELGVSRQAVWDFCKRNQIKKPPKAPLPLVELAKRKARFAGKPEDYAETTLKFRRKKQNAKNGKWEFTIDFWDLVWPTHCPILGLELLYSSPFDVRADASVSFDRIDSTKGYIPGNVQVLSWRANRIKNDGTAEEHQKIADFMRKGT